MNIKFSAYIMIAFLAFSGVISVISDFSASAQSKQTQPGAVKNRHDKPYDVQLLRLAELLGSIHYLRELCGANDGQKWRDQMSGLVKAEGTSAVRRVKLVNSFNKGYRGYRRTYRSCTRSARLAVSRSMKEGAAIAAAIVKTNN
ncbi:MAG: TIGR02301 family protein [Methyloligellaceae bacterium]